MCKWNLYSIYKLTFVTELLNLKIIQKYFYSNNLKLKLIYIKIKITDPLFVPGQLKQFEDIL